MQYALTMTLRHGAMRTSARHTYEYLFRMLLDAGIPYAEADKIARELAR